MATNTPTDELLRPDILTPAYALRELADWIEHRTGGDEPRDVARIVLGREVANALDELATNTAATIGIENMPANDIFIGVDMANDPDVCTVAPYQIPVAKAPAEPVEDHQCSSLRFDRDVLTGLLRARCNLGRCTSIDFTQFEHTAENPQGVIIRIARIVAAEHGLDAGKLFEELRRNSLKDLRTFTPVTSPLPTP